MRNMKTIPLPDFGSRAHANSRSTRHHPGTTRLLTSGPFLCLIFASFGAELCRGDDALKFFKNYFVTGDYVVGGVALRGQGVPNATAQNTSGGVATFATGTIHMSGVPGYVANGVPQHADIVAAYLYWETIAGTATDPPVL